MEDISIQTEEILGPHPLMEEFRKMKEEMEIIKKSVDRQAEEMDAIKTLHQAELKNRDTIIDKLRTRINVLENNVAVSNLKIEHLEINIDDNEQYSRRHSLRLSGLEKRKYNETADDVMRGVYDEMDRLDAPINELEIDRAHRTGKKYKDEEGKWQQPILLKFNSWKARNAMYKLRKESRFHMKADLTNRNDHVLSYAKEQVSLKGSIANEYVNYVYADANCSLMAFTSTGRFLRFNSEYDFEMLLLHIDNTTRMSESIYDTIRKDIERTHPGE